MEGWELSAVEGGGGASERARRGMAPPGGLFSLPSSSPRATHPNSQAREERTAGPRGWVVGTEHGRVLVRPGPWQAG